MLNDDFRLLADNIPTLAWMADADGYIFWYNRRWHEYCGTTPEQMEGWGWQSVHDPAVLPGVLERWQASIATGAPFEMIFPLRGADGVFRPFLTRVQPARTEQAGQEGQAGQAITRWFGTNTEVSAQIAAENSLRESEATLGAVLDALPIGVVIADARGRIVRDNAANRALWGVPPETLSWQQYGEWVGYWPRTGERIRAEEWALSRALLKGETVTGELVESEQFGTAQRRFFLNNAAPVRDAQGVIVGGVVAELDVTEARQAEAALRDSEARLRELNETLELRIEAAVAERAAAEEQLRQAQKMEAVGQLTGGLAHDFNNLLTGISGSLERLQVRASQGRLAGTERYIDAAQDAARRAAVLTHRLLAFSRRQTLDPKPTDINRLVAGMEELIRRTVGVGVGIEVLPAVGLWTTLIDPGQLESALLNLCINARDAMPGGGRLTIETSNTLLDEAAARARDLPAGPYVTLCVSDTGTGMTQEVAERAFEPFFTTKRIGEGTGLGLSMVYGFARQSGGQARIVAGAGRGATIGIDLPRYQGDGSHGAESPEAAGQPQASRRPTVLVVDDEPTVRMLVTEVLEELGYVAMEAADGPDGLAILQSDAVLDLLITDVGLPGGMNGRQVADAGRLARPGLDVLFITGYAENAVIGSAPLERGMHVLTKPFGMDVLAARVRGIVGGGEVSSPF